MKRKVKSFIPDKSSVLINNSTLGNQATYSKVNYPFIPVEYIATSKKSNIMEKKSIYKIDKKHPGRSLFVSEKGLKEVSLLTLWIPARTI